MAERLAGFDQHHDGSYNGKDYSDPPDQTILDESVGVEICQLARRFLSHVA
jgi:hypothetical protein